MFDWVFQYFGVKSAVVLGGAAGGGVRALLLRGDPYTSVTAIVVGALAAAYLTAPIYAIMLKYTSLPVDASMEHSMSFLIGLSGLFICEGVLLWAKKWSVKPSIPQ